MEERQTKIEVGKGLEESRLNTEFIDMLRKYSTPALIVLAVVIGGYALWTRYAEHRKRSLDTALVELDEAEIGANPKALLAIAQDHAGRGAVPLRARLDAADLHLRAARTGVPSGAKLEVDGSLPKDTPALTPAQRESELNEAESLYKAVVSGADSTLGQRLLAWNGLMGLAAVEESRGQYDSAKANYTRVATEAKELGFDVTASVAQHRIDTLDALKNAPTLLQNAQLHASITPVEKPITLPMSDIQMKTSSGQIITPGANTNMIPLTVGPDGKPIAPPPAPGATPPVPAPAPKP